MVDWGDVIDLLLSPVDYGVVPRIQIIILCVIGILATTVYYLIAEWWNPEEGGVDITGRNVNGGG